MKTHAAWLLPFVLLAGRSEGQDVSSRPEWRHRPGPWDQDVLAYRITTNGSAERLAVFERAGVPTLAQLKDGRLLAAHQHFPENDDANFDKVAVRFSSDQGRTWSPPEVIRLDGLPEGMRFPFDPTLVPLPDGRVRLYFTSVRGRRIEEQPPAIYSAISSNGVHYAVEPGIRFGIEGRIVIDCAVVLHKETFHLYAPDNGAAGRRPDEEDRRRTGVAYHATSRDGLKFTRQQDVNLDRFRWLGNAQSDGRLVAFYGTGDGPGENWIATSEDGRKWKIAETRSRSVGADPGAVKLADGSLIVVATGPPRPGTPSAARRPQPQP
jgi:hypothetical protein